MPGNWVYVCDGPKCSTEVGIGREPKSGVPEASELPNGWRTALVTYASDGAQDRGAFCSATCLTEWADNR
jgi:hypothetical protein